MDILSLAGFVATIRETKRIRFGDVRRLSRDILPGGITSRAEAEMLLALDRAVTRPDPAWADFLTTAVPAFARREAEPIPGDPWLTAALGSRPTRTGLAILEALRGPPSGNTSVALPATGAGIGLAEQEIDPARTPSLAGEPAAAERVS